MSTMTNGATNVGHVDQIREIIVGDHIRSLEARLEALEQKMLDEVGIVREQLAQSQAEQQTRADALDGAKMNRDAFAGALVEIASRLRDGAV